MLSGWGVRPNDWQWGLNLQQELLPRVSLDVGYNRRYFRWRGQGTVTDNLLAGPVGLQPVDNQCAARFAASRRRRLSDRRSTPLRRRPRREARPTTSPSKRTTVRERTDYWHGVDITVNARLRNAAEPPGGHEHGPCRHRQLRHHGSDRQSRPAQLPQRGAVPDDPSWIGHLHVAKGGRSGFGHDAIAAGHRARTGAATVPARAEYGGAAACSAGSRRARWRRARRRSRFSTTITGSTARAERRSTCGSRRSCGSAAREPTSASILATC